MPISQANCAFTLVELHASSSYSRNPQWHSYNVLPIRLSLPQLRVAELVLRASGSIRQIQPMYSAYARCSPRGAKLPLRALSTLPIFQSRTYPLHEGEQSVRTISALTVSCSCLHHFILNLETLTPTTPSSGYSYHHSRHDH